MSGASSVQDMNENHPIHNIEDSLGEVGASVQESAVSHLYKSIAELEPETNTIDAKILAQVTNSLSTSSINVRNSRF